MASLNKVHLIGNLTRDPERRVTPKGTSITSFALAINRKWRDETGAERDEVTYVDIEAWGKQADAIAKYCTKGRPLYVEGRLRLDQWEDKTTKEKRSRMKVVLETFQFLGDGKRSESAPSPNSQTQSPSTPAPRAATPNAQENLDEDVPF